MTTVKGSVFKAIEDDEGVAEVLIVKSALFDLINNHIDDNNLTQEAAGKLMHVHRTRISAIKNGKLQGFSIDYLVAMTARAGLNCIYVARC